MWLELLKDDCVINGARIDWLRAESDEVMAIFADNAAREMISASQLFSVSGFYL